MANNKNNSSFGATMKRWFARFWKGGANALADEMEEKKANMSVEDIVSPMQQVLRNFFERKMAVAALVILVLMFVTMFVGPLMMPKYYDAYTEVTQKSIAPNMSMMSVPKELAKDVKKKAEDAKVAVRNIRRDGNDAFKKLGKSSEVSEDEVKQLEDQLQKLTDKFIKEIDVLMEAKSKEIMTV